MGLGDLITEALSSIGLSKKLVEQWLGSPCNCEQRRQKLNEVGAWARRVLSGRSDKAREYLDRIIDS